VTLGGPSHAAFNASLNAASAVLIFTGWRMIKAGRRDAHRSCMLAATGVSTLFLASYLLRFAYSGTHYYPGAGVWKAIYLTLLFSHMALAVITPVLVLRAIWLATQARLPEHRRVVAWALPIWMYVSVTGVLVYWLLYHPPGHPPG
jgi:putative membrane protein